MKRFSQWLATAAVTAGLLGAAFIGPAQAAAPKAAPATRRGGETPVVIFIKRNMPRLPGIDAPQAQPQRAPSGGDPTPAPQAQGKTIYLDPGHGSSDVGAVHKDANGNVDLMERDANLAIALKLADMLRQKGHNVVLTRTDSQAPAMERGTPADLQARADKANRAGADIFVSIHNNGSANTALKGTETFYCADRANSADSQRLAKLVQNGFIANLAKAGYETVDRGAKDDSYIGHYAVLGEDNLARPTQMPAIIGESLFVSNEQDAAQLKRPEIQTAIAKGYFDGIMAYFNNA